MAEATEDKKKGIAAILTGKHDFSRPGPVTGFRSALRIPMLAPAATGMPISSADPTGPGALPSDRHLPMP